MGGGRAGVETRILFNSCTWINGQKNRPKDRKTDRKIGTIRGFEPQLNPVVTDPKVREICL